jgi:hypothetical protein
MRLYNSHLSNVVIKGSKDYQAYKKLRDGCFEV